MNLLEQKAYELGHFARETNGLIHDNPYNSIEESDLYYSWSAGWYDKDSDTKDE